ncbi:hypothetical protein OHAE_4826 [Ochrobactrum soli]|uniref:Uncharacterized protein n=1 Tax=Ochrobactrum soli TaxID=2448455 RepID=A0A2P9HD50_9HYPH|nr:hypothetical protein OHAE_4826 [[Ochrobactrum] soli]
MIRIQAPLSYLVNADIKAVRKLTNASSGEPEHEQPFQAV